MSIMHDVDGAIAADPYYLFPIFRHSGHRYRFHDCELVLQPRLSAAVFLGETLHQPLIKGLCGSELPTPTGLQPLI